MGIGPYSKLYISLIKLILSMFLSCSNLISYLLKTLVSYSYTVLEILIYIRDIYNYLVFLIRKTKLYLEIKLNMFYMSVIYCLNILMFVSYFDEKVKQIIKAVSCTSKNKGYVLDMVKLKGRFKLSIDKIVEMCFHSLMALGLWVRFFFHCIVPSPNAHCYFDCR